MFELSGVNYEVLEQGDSILVRVRVIGGSSYRDYTVYIANRILIYVKKILLVFLSIIW